MEAVTGKDMFGNQLTEEQRHNRLLMALGIGGVAGAAKVADKVASGTKIHPLQQGICAKAGSYAKATITDIARSGKTTLKNIGEEIGKKEIPKRISMEQVSFAGGPTLRQVVMEKQTIKEAYQKFTVKDSKVEGVSGESISKGTDKNITQGARYGERKIPNETYAKLRRASPSSKIQREVNKNIDDIIGTEDFALPGKIIDKKLHADHIVSLENSSYGRF
ncbi:hypothetical protein ACFRK4_11090 [Peribacillus butanolivorans]|uniref:hypothetical protein n=1 Tax=Peribacillus butanolivorans TaxID=421767 RepID=UPI00366AC1DB